MKFYSKRKRRKDTDTQSERSAGMSEQGIRKEITALLLIALGILMMLSLLSYHQSDPVGLQDENNLYQVKNWLGPFGATIAAPIFQWTLGFPSLVFPVIILVLGFFILLRRPLKKLLQISLLLLSWCLFLSIILALPEAFTTMGNVNSFYPSGLFGGLIVVYLIKTFSRFGTLFILFVVLLILGIITFKFQLSHVSIAVTEFLKNSPGRISQFLLTLSSPFKTWLEKRGKTPGESSTDGEEITEFQGDRQMHGNKEESPSGQEVIAQQPKAPIEIIHRRKLLEEQEDLDVDKDTPKFPQIAKQPEQSKVLTADGLGFEVLEPHQEKVLDYDALIRDSLAKYQFPSSELLIEKDFPDSHLSEDELRMNAQLLEETMAQFGIQANVNRVVEGPVITLYEVRPALGVRINQIVSLADDLALAMRAKGIRMIAPIPGKDAIGIEIPNREPSTVYFKSLVKSETFINFDARLPLGIGKTISGEVFCADLTKMPHLLMAGATGSGKSVGINTMISSLLYRVPPSDLKFVMIDPKKLELSIYAKLKDHYLATCSEIDEIVITHPQNAILILRSVVTEMESRYNKLAALGVREITHYNNKIEEYKRNGETSEEFRRLPYLVVVVDELADLILSAMREVEEPITRLAQMARAVGIHLIMATQRPSVDILTGLIKANFPARIAYQVATRPDSKVILDIYGAEKLIGNGDMLFMPPGKVKPLRLQNPLITTEEVESILKHIRRQPKFPPYELKLIGIREKGPGTAKSFERDELFEDAKATVIRYQQGSVSLLQRKLKIGYARAARIIDELEEAGIVAPPNQEGKAREVLVSGYTPQNQNSGEEE
ncbi:MAG: hypothetical protein A2Y94_01345 [Caldithrix sp. RBG_13_44_9]|nr:MAG: hypothetical protein A2Y94_01345 [Caldithrix sp. RBG_13_44_9]